MILGRRFDRVRLHPSARGLGLGPLKKADLARWALAVIFRLRAGFDTVVTLRLVI